MTPIRWFQSLFSRSIHQPRRRRSAERLAPSRLDVLEKRVLLSATELVVTTNQDVTSNTDGLITLREALAFAASNPGADTITFGNGSAIAGGTNFTDATGDTITLGGTQLTIGSDVTIDGSGAALLSISGNNASRVFVVNSGVTAQIRDVSITGGNAFLTAGGGIVNGGTLTVSHSTISGNTASLDGGGISSNGPLTISDSSISGNTATNNGGGIYSNGPLTVSHSSIAGNTSRSGGGIASLGTLTVSHSVISGNTATGNGSGIANNGPLTVSHSTIFGNTATGNGSGIYNIGGSTTIVNSTLVNNRADSDGNSSGTGGGIWTFNDGSTFTTLHNTIVAGNFVGTGATANEVANKPLVSGSRNNLIGHTGSAGGLTQGSNGNIVGALVADIFETGALANNGGSTQTIALKASSPAVNAGDNASVPADALDLDGDLNTTEPVPFDQRGTGFVRIIGTAVDIGAIEADEAPSLVVNTAQDVVNSHDGLTSLREALAFAASNPGDDTITFGNGSAIAGGTNFTDATGDTITLGGTELSINSNVTLDGPGAALLSISGNNASRVFVVSSGVTAEIRDVTIAGGNSDRGPGGGIFSGGTLTVSHSTISGNTAGAGGGIYSNGTLTVSLSTISGNTAYSGGGIYSNRTVTVSRSTISGNTGHSGGGIKSFGTLTVSHSTISGNTAYDGGGIRIAAQLTVSHSTISGNTATASGGGIYNVVGLTTIVNSTLVNNRADSDGNSSGTGGGIRTFNDGTTFTTLRNTIVAGNLVGTGTTANDLAEKPLEAASRNNLIGDAGSAGGLTHGTNGNIVSSLVADIFETGVLANNGGPTQTIALKASSPAVNAGDNASVPADALDLDGDLNTTEPVPFDQRGTGFVRIIGTAVDIGAIEADETPSLVVNTTQDVVNSHDGLTSLREALAFALSNPGADTITFGNGSAIAGGSNFTDATGDTITLGGTHLTINSNVTLDGPGAALLSISGNNASRVFSVNFGVTAEIRDVTITGGSSIQGGGILSLGPLTVSHSTISGNASTNSGGGIASFGPLTVSHSTISGNTASEDGGGIFSNETLMVSHSTISGNTTSGNGGGIFNGENSTTIVNSTLVNNRADSDGNSSGTGGGISTFNNGVTFTTLQNTIVAGNSVGTGTTASDVANKPLEAASRSNLIGDAGSSGGLTNGTNGNIVGALMADIFETGVLANNGGPTQTIALKASSPAINAGDNASVPADALDLDGDLNTTEPVPFDQRGTGFVRTVVTVDMGAIEADEAPGLVVTTTQDVVNSRDGLTSLREALAFAASNPGADTITFGNGSAIAGGTNFTDATGDTITLGGTQLTINSNVTLDGPGAALLSISGNNASLVFRVNSGVAAEIRDVTITGGNLPNGLGGGIFSSGTLTVSHSTISGNSSGTGFGGGIFSNGTLTVSHSAISGNTARHGGGISNTGTLMVSHSSISGNAASGQGGGIESVGTLTVSHSSISGNTASVDGGGIMNQGSMTVIHSTIFGNAAGSNGGGILNYDRSGTIVNSTLVNNRADSDGDDIGTGGGIWTFNNNQTFTTLRNTIVTGNLVGTGVTANEVAEKPLEVASRNNLIGDAGSAGGLTNGTNGNIVGALVADIFETGALANNGGPTQTMAIKLGGPAVNAGDNASVPADTLDLDGDLNTTEPVPFDQRGSGSPRVIGGIVDIGAYERANSTPTDVTLSSNTIAENAGANVVIGSLAGVDPDPNDALTLSLPVGLTDNALFNLSGGNLQANASFNFEANSSYTVTLRVTDFEGATFDKTLTISVTDVNEAPTALNLQNTTTSLAENVSTAAAIKLADIVVTDDALGTNALSLSGADAALFELSGSNELMLKAGTVLDFETKSTYNVTVEVDDVGVGSNPDASTAFTLTLDNLIDVTPDPDAFVFTYSALAVDVTHAINSGATVFIGKFLLSSPITLDGLAANDSVRVIGTSGDDVILVQSTGLTINGAGLILDGLAQITLAGDAGNDTYTFDTDASLGTYTLEDSAGTGDTISLAPTSSLPVTLDLSQSTAQAVNANLSLILSSAADFENAIGGDQDDILLGNGLGNRLTGNAGRDRLNGLAGSDELIGGQGDDTYVFGLATSLEADTVNEATNGGTDTLDFSAQTTAVTAYLNQTSVQTVHTNRTLQLNSHTTVENLMGGSGSDLLVGNGLNNTLTGGTGDDTLNGTTGSDMLVGGLNNDIYTFGTSLMGEADQVVENTGEGLDTLSFATRTTGVVVYLNLTSPQTVHSNRTLQLNSHSTIENLIGGLGSDLLVGNALDNALTGGAGHDILNGTTGSDMLFGGLDNDTYTFGTATAGEADQVIENSGEGLDTLSFATRTTSVTVYLNSTSVQPVHPDRTLQLNSINDFENLAGGSGADLLVGNALDNTLTGGAGDDTLNGTTGSDTLVGGQDNDTYTFGASLAGEADQVIENTNEGVDTLSFATQTTAVSLFLNTTAVQTVHANRTLKLNSFSTFENAVGGSEADVLVGNAQDNTLIGGAGDDLLNGTIGSDILVGGLNNDAYTFGASLAGEADQVVEYTNEGVDTLSFATQTVDIMLDLGSTAIQSVHLNRTLKLNSGGTIENASGGSGNDTLTGNSLENRLNGGHGNNILIGLDGSDILEAGNGRDILIGGRGADTLTGGGGDDILIAGRTLLDTDVTSLSTIQTEWLSANDYATRMTNVKAGVGSPVVSLQPTINVLNDAAQVDSLTGGTALDWYFRALDDTITDLFAGETVETL